ncbi:MAG: hypothetical protein RLZZ618_821 [Pseudomonadota bacterium]
MNNTSVDTRPPSASSLASASAHRNEMRTDMRNDGRPPVKANDAQRRAFEKLMSDDEDTEEDTAAGSGSTQGIVPQAEGRVLPGAVFRDLKDERGPLGADVVPTLQRDPAQPVTLSAAAADIPVPAPQFQPAPVQQANLFAHLALPHVQADELGRFEVLGGSAVSHVEVNATPQGGLTVAIGTSVQHASLLDRHLPQLQRRLPDRVTAHVRVQERDPSEQRRD